MLACVEAPLFFRRKQAKGVDTYHASFVESFTYVCDYRSNGVTAQTSRQFARVKRGAMSVLLKA